jgi:hypothetical protein
MKRPALWLALCLFLLSVGLLAYRILGLGYPVVPTVAGQTWQLSIDAWIRPRGAETHLILALPSEQTGRIIIKENFSSREMNLTILQQGQTRLGLWTQSGMAKETAVTYNALIHFRPKAPTRSTPPSLGDFPASAPEEGKVLARTLVTRWQGLSPREKIRAIGETLLGRWIQHPPADEDLRAWMEMGNRLGSETSLLALFRAANLPARTVEGLALVEGITNETRRWVEAWDGRKWIGVRLSTGETFEDTDLRIPLLLGGGRAASVSGGDLADIRYFLNREVLSNWSLHFERIKRSSSLLDRWSLFQLPEEFQRTFRILLLVPIGALMISILRNLAGFPTFGIFMPVLMALAFRNTGILYGLGIFFGVLILGYAVRRALDKLRLLLVPRMSVLLTLVIASFTVVALIGSKFGLREFMAVGLLPFVILTMVIERFFVLIEEAGVKEGVRTAVGSAATAFLTFEIISWEPLQLTFFLYPELLAAVSACQILVGQYSGYRLSELFRFRSILGSS